MRTSANYRAIPVLAAMLLAAGAVSFRVLANLQRLQDQPRALPPVIPATMHFPAQHWPDVMCVAFSPHELATTAQRRFAIRIAAAQIKAARTRRFNSTAFAQGRFLRYPPTSDTVYFLEICRSGQEFGFWRNVEYSDAMTVPGNSGVFLRVGVVDPDGKKYYDLFYANPTY